MILKLYKIFNNFSKQMTQKNISSFAASTAFFLFISLIPILYLTCALLPYTILTEQNLQQLIGETAPNVVGTFIISMMDDVYVQSAGVISVSVLVAVWSAGKGVMGLMRGLNAINNVPEDRNYILVRVISAFYTVIMVVALLFTLVFMGLGRYLFDYIINKLIVGKYVWEFITHFRFVYSWIALTLVFTLIYTYLPNRRLVLKWQIPGALFSAVIWSVFSWGFSIYISYFNGFSNYGSLTTIIIVMLWFYCMIYIVLIGAHINRYFAPVYESLYRNRQYKRVRLKD